MRKTSNINDRISIKLFIITAISFTTLLVCALIAQSHYYQRSYTIVNKRNIINQYDKLSKELNNSDMQAATVAEIFQKYKEAYNTEAMIFLNDGKTQKFQLSSLTSYQYSSLLIEGIAFYNLNFNDYFDIPHRYSEQEFIGENGRAYVAIAANLLKDDEVLLLIGDYEHYFAPDSPGMFETYPIYVFLIGIVVSVVLSYFFSRKITKPLVQMNAIAKDMSEFNFERKVILSRKDEFGQLGDSLNTLSENLNNTLEKLTTANIKLQNDIEKERDLEKARKEFVVNVSHELKTPLAIIKGYGEALKDDIRIDKREHYINQIVYHSDEMSKLIQDMLDLSKIESGSYIPQKTDFDLSLLTQSIIESFQFLLEQKSICISYSFFDKEIVIFADRLKIGQVISNFIHNAIRHTPNNGNIFISISKTKENIVFDIENEGNSIAPEKIDKVWDRFYREEEDRSKKTGGTGLGLAISSIILQMHQMEYGVKNTKTGVMFYFKISP